MIARVWRGVVARDRRDAYVAYVEATGVAAYRRTPGCRLSAILTRDLDPGNPPADDRTVTNAEATERVGVSAFSIWDSETDIQAFAGLDINAMVLYPEDEDYLLAPSTLVHHHVTSLAIPTTEETR